MIVTWLEQPIWMIFTVLAVGFCTVVVLIVAMTFLPRLRPVTLTFAGVVPAYFSAVAILLALLTGFVANDAWDRQEDAAHIAQAEADHVLAVYELSIAAAPDMSKIRTALRAYVNAVLDDEWRRMTKDRASQRADDALGVLLQNAAQPEITRDAGAPTQTALLSSILKIRSDRGERLALNVHNADNTKWLALFVLGVLTQVAIGIVHMERPRAQIAALMIFTTALVSTLGLIAVHQWPFDGPCAIQPDALRQAHETIARDVTVTR